MESHFTWGGGGGQFHSQILIPRWSSTPPPLKTKNGKIDTQFSPTS